MLHGDTNLIIQRVGWLHLAKLNLYSRLMKERQWTLGDTKVDELYEYKNLGVLKNYAGSFTSNILDNTEKTRKKAGMIFPLISIVAKLNL